MSVATDHLTFFRSDWATRFVDTCTIGRVTGRTLNTSTGVYTPTVVSQYSGPCLVRPQAPASAQAGQELIEQRNYRVFLPYTVTAVKVDDVVTVTSIFDGVLNGKQLIVRNILADTYNTRRVLECEDNQGASG